MTTPALLILALAALWALLWLLNRPSRGALTRELRRLDVDGELLPALREGDDWTTNPPVITVRLPKAEAAPLSEIETRRPARAPSWEADVAVPLAQATFTAMAACITTALIAWGMGWSWRVVVIVTGATLALSWLWRLRLVDGLLYSVEVLTQHDVNHDGRIGAPHVPIVVNPSEARSTVKQLAQEGAHESRRRDLLAFVARCYTVGTSEAAHGVKATGPDRAKYCELRDTLLSLGVAKWRNPERPRAGWTLAVSQSEAVDVVNRHVL